MASGKLFDFLKPAWGIELQAKAIQEIESNVEALNRSVIEEYIKDSDIRKLGVNPSLPKDISRMTAGTIPPGQYLVQVTKIADITQPARFQEDFEGGKWRLLCLELADGEQTKMKAIEYVNVKSLGVHLPPGTKLLLKPTANNPLYVQNGHILLTPDVMQVLGGNVERLVESWRASKEVEETRLLWRTEGIKKKIDGEGPPPWVDFNVKAARGSGGAAERRAAEEERREWRQGAQKSAAAAAQADEEKGGPRFQLEQFAGEGDAPKAVKTQVSSSAFKQAEGSGKGKGKGKAKGDAPPARGRRDDDWGGEEKRAPQQASTLAAFIKPTKKGELSDEAVNILTDPGVEWEEEGWEDGGWEEGGWDASSWGWDAWSGGGYPSGGKGGKGGGKGRKGGGKGKRRKGGGGKGYR